jgi:hypothetical protein
VEEVAVAAVEEEAGVADGGGVGFGGGEAFGAGAEAAVDVVLEAGVGVLAVEVDVATGNFEVAVDKVDEAVGEVGGEVGAVVLAVFFEAAGDVDAGEFFVGDFQVGVGFVVAEEDVEAGLVLLDEVVFEGEGLLFVIDEDVVDVVGGGEEGACAGVGETVLVEVAADAVAEAFRLADVEDLAFGVFIEIHAGLERELGGFLAEAEDRLLWHESYT